MQLSVLNSTEETGESDFDVVLGVGNEWLGLSDTKTWDKYEQSIQEL